jgi:hypothetical protein
MRQVGRHLWLMQAQHLLCCRIVWIPQRQAAYDLHYKKPSSVLLREAINRFDSVSDGIWEIRESAVSALMHAAQAGGTETTLSTSLPALQNHPTEVLPPSPVFPPGISNLRHSPRRPTAPTA